MLADQLYSCVSCDVIHPNKYQVDFAFQQYTFKNIALSNPAEKICV